MLASELGVVETMYQEMIRMQSDFQGKIDVNDEKTQSAAAQMQAESLQALEVLKQDLVDKFNQFEESSKKVEEDMRTWTAGFRAEIQDEFLRRGAQSPPGLAGSGDRERRTKHDKKDLAVWRLAGKVTNLEFRHWEEAVEVNLEAIHN